MTCKFLLQYTSLGSGMFRSRHLSGMGPLQKLEAPFVTVATPSRAVPAEPDGVCFQRSLFFSPAHSWVGFCSETTGKT